MNFTKRLNNNLLIVYFFKKGSNCTWRYIKMDIEKICSDLNYSIFPKYTIKGFSNVFHTIDYLIRKGNKEFAIFLAKKENLINVYLKSVVFNLDSNIPTLVLITSGTNETPQCKFHNPAVKIFENIEQFKDFLSKI